MKGTPKEIIQSSLDDVDTALQIYNMEELTSEVNFLSGYLQYQSMREIITQQEYTNYKITLSDKIKKIKDRCECKIKGTK